jgi:hypothetical protein
LRGVALKKILFLIRGHKSADYALDEEAQRETWAKHDSDSFQCVWVHGLAEIQRPLLENRKIYIPCEDTYEKLLTKTIFAIRTFLEYPFWDYCIVTNTSSYWNIGKTLEAIVAMREKQQHVAGFIEVYKWENSTPIRYQDKFINGAGIYLSRAAAMSLAKMNPEIYRGIADDVAISHYLQKEGWFMHPKPRNTIYSNHIFIPRAHIRVKGYGNRELTRQRMHLIDDYFAEKTFLGRFQGYTRIMRNEIESMSRPRLSDIPRYLKREISRVRANKSARKPLG